MSPPPEHPSVAPRSLPVDPNLLAETGQYLAVLSRDARFDGRFFTAVTSTGIYCRPVCKVKAPKRSNCRFYALAAQAEAAGYRPCMRCRPELAPAHQAWSAQDSSASLALAAARMLADPAMASLSLTAISLRLGISDRHLRRIFEAHMGVSPLQYLQTHRLLSAKQLLTDTRLGVLEVAMASGFSSLRRFNDAFLAHYRMPPSRLRRSAGPIGKLRPAFAGAATVRLAYRPPYDVESMLQFWRTRQIDALQITAGPAEALPTEATFFIANKGRGCWTMCTFGTFFDPNAAATAPADSKVLTGHHLHTGWLGFQFDATECLVHLAVSDSLLVCLPSVIAQVRAALDLDCDPMAIDGALAAHFPTGQGMRVPGALNGFELAVRAILGQQVTVAAGRTFTQRVVARYGAEIQTPWPALNRLFPTPAALAGALPQDLGALGIVKQRQAALMGLAQAVVSGRLCLSPQSNQSGVETQMATLQGLAGVGPWTANYIAMRALRWPDAFPAGDVALHNALGIAKGGRAAAEAEALSQAWRPWRSYAVLRAWSGHHTPQGEP